MDREFAGMESALDYEHRITRRPVQQLRAWIRDRRDEGMNGTSRSAIMEEIGKDADRDVPFMTGGWNKEKVIQCVSGRKLDRAPKRRNRK